MRKLKIISGGQTGVDRAALDVAIACSIEHGGWCPLNRIAEDGRIPDHYRLQEMPSELYTDRTRQNVIDSDGTLILYRYRMQGGTALTSRIAKELRKPMLPIRLDRTTDITLVAEWIERESISILNVAGPRASGTPQIYAEAYAFLHALLECTP